MTMTDSPSTARSVRLLLLAALCTLAGPLITVAAAQKVLIVALGDSYSSGEGNPDTPGQGCDAPPLALSANCAIPPVWGTDPEAAVCHRSAKAWPTLTANAFRDQHPELLVSFQSFACSGAKITDLVDNRQHPEQPLPQLDELEKAFATTDAAGNMVRLDSPPQIDALLLSIGGNDIGFGPTVTGCIIAPFCYAFPGVNGAHNDSDLPGLETMMRGRYGKLRDKLSAINARGFIKIANVFLTEYPNPMYDERGQLCGLPHAPVGDYLDGGLRDETRWAGEKVIPLLDRLVKEGASMLVAPSAPRGFYVSGTVEGMMAHGYCSTTRFINLVRDSVIQQGESSGAVHPNAGGQAVYRDAVLPAIGRIIPPAVRQFTGPTGTPGETTVFLPQGLRLAWGEVDRRSQQIQIAKRAVWQGAAQPLEAPLQPHPDSAGATPWGWVTPEHGWTISAGWNNGPSHAVVSRPSSATDYAVRFCTDAMCSRWSEPVRVAPISGFTLPQPALTITRNATGDLDLALGRVPDASTVYRIAYRRVAGIPLPMRDRRPIDIAGTLPPIDVPGGVSTPATPPPPAWRNVSAPTGAMSAVLSHLDDGVYDVFARRCGWAFESSSFRSTESCGQWSKGVEVANVAPYDTPIASLASNRVQWSSNNGRFVSVYQVAARSIQSWSVHQYQATAHAAPLSDFGIAAKINAVSVRACNLSGCTPWSAVVTKGNAAATPVPGNLAEPTGTTVEVTTPRPPQ